MAHKPIVVKQLPKPFVTSRSKFHEENSSKIIVHRTPKPIYKSRSVNSSLEKNSKQTILSKMENKIISADDVEQFIQPNMRFKFRTDLERVYETLNNRNFGSVSKKPVEQQLKQLKLFSPKKKKSSPVDSISESQSVSSQEGSIIERIQYTEDIPHELLPEEKKKKPKPVDYKKRLVDNSGAKKFFKELHNKTFFKAASTFLIAQTKKKSKSEKKKPKPIEMAQTVKIKDLTRKSKENAIAEYCKKIPLNRGNFDLVKGNPLLYNVNFNPLRKNEEDQFDPVKFEKIKKLAVTYKLRTTNEIEGFQDNATIKSTKFMVSIRKQDKFRDDSLILSDPFVFFSSFKANEMMEGRKQKDIERIMIDGRVYPKYEIKTITEKVLSKCNYLHKRKR